MKAVALIIFNRPDLVLGLLDAVRKYKPARLYIIADGPRINKPGEAEACNLTRETVEQAIDWRCNIHRVYSEVNLGCRRRIVSGLDSVFELEEDAIILEDDTHPSPSFFTFCERALDLFAQDDSVFSVTGSNILPRCLQTDKAYLSKFTHIWGWATWRRSWLLYDRDLSCLDDGRVTGALAWAFRSARHRSFWRELLQSAKRGRIDTWDYQLQATAWLNRMQCLTPGRNLVKNVGFRADATHTVKPSVFDRKTASNLPQGVVERILGKQIRHSGLYDAAFANYFHNPNRILRVLRDKVAVARSKKLNRNPTL